MSPPCDPNPRRQTRPGAAFRHLAPALAAVALLAAPASAQRLAGYLPAETVFALGTVDLNAHAGVLDDVLAEWRRLDLSEKLMGALGGLDLGDALDAPGVEPALPDALDGLDVMSVLGAEAWLGLSVSAFNPLPALTLVAHVDPAIGDRFDALLAELAAEAEALTLSEGAATIVVAPPDGPFVLSGSRFGELLAFSTNPDVLRSVLRQAQGSPDPSFTGSESYRATLGALGAGALSLFLDLAAVTEALAPMALGLGFDASVARLRSALETVGVMASTTRITDDGLRSESVQLLRIDARDAALFGLLTGDQTAPRALIRAVPDSALSVQVSGTEPSAWWDYLVGLVAGLPELAVPDVDAMVRDLTGVDLRSDFFSWTGRGILTMSTGTGTAVEPGLPADDLLGETVFVLATTDDAAARSGLTRLIESFGATVSAFTDPMAMGGPVPRRERTVEGVPVTSFDLFPGASVTIAVTDGLALIDTTEEGVGEAVRAAALGGALAPTLQRMLGEVPAAATGFSVSDDRAMLEGTAAQVAAQVQLLAGFGGAGALDFDATTLAAEALEEFLFFLAAKMGGSVNWSTVDGSVVRGYGLSEISWR